MAIEAFNRCGGSSSSFAACALKLGHADSSVRREPAGQNSVEDRPCGAHWSWGLIAECGLAGSSHASPNLADEKFSWNLRAKEGKLNSSRA
jgi:hypothetical protein